MYRLRIKLKQSLLLGGDYAMFLVALALTLLLRYGRLDLADWNAHALPFALLGVIWILSFYVVGLYDLRLTQDSFKFFRTFLEGMIVNLGVALAFFYLFPIFGIAPRTNLILYFACSLLLGYAWRLLYNRAIAPAIFRNRVLFVGHTADAARIHSLLQSSAAGFELVAVAETAPGTRFDTGTVTWHVNINAIDEILKERNVQTIVLGHRPDEIPGLRDALYKTLFSPVALIDRATLEEAVTGRVPLEYVTQTWFLEHLRESEKAWYESFKRFTDVLLAIPFGLMTLILFPFVALLVRLSSPGPILIKQLRTGKYGKPFLLYKFRTMISNAPDGSAEGQGRPQFAVVNDPRITKIGHFLRKVRLDELPQIWNILRGDMSFAGPRPERPEFVEELTRQVPYYALRHLTRPGLTGWAQVNFGYASTLDENLKKLQYDLYYIKNRSLLMDGTILLKTIGIVLRRKGT